MEPKEQDKLAKRINLVVFILRKINKFKNSINNKMEGKYSPTLISLGVTIIAFMITSIILFIPNYLGVADDGSVTKIMNAADIYYIQEEVGDRYNNYFIKTYSRAQMSGQEGNDIISSQVILVKAAVYLDDVITQDKYFDIRFLALLYTLLYLPALFLIIKQACARVKHFSEGMVIGIVGLLIFSDISYITYFNSFYPEAIWFISLIYCVGFALSFQENRTIFKDVGGLALLVLSSSVLTSSKRQCAVIGIIVAIFCVKLIFIPRHWLWGIACALSALFLCFISVLCIVNLDSDFDDTSKFHAMTRGVLFEADNPEKTLSEFGIAASYEMLTDASAYDYLPLVKANDPSIITDFLDKYTTLDITTYYIRHPGKLIGMIDVAIKSNFIIRRSYCGNYEKSVGMPERAKSLFWSTWSTLKDTSIPKTIGYLFLLVGAMVILFRRGYTLRPIEDRRSTIFLDMLFIILIILLSQAVVTIIYSGDAQMAQHCFLVSFGVDILSYFVFTELVHKLNII